jgi:NitT/TauT family transport system permease protein
MFLAILGAVSSPVEDVELFYENTRRLTYWQTMRIRVLCRLPSLVATISGSASLAVVGSILAEFLAGDTGVGYLIRIALYENRLDKIIVVLFVIGICSWMYVGSLEVLSALFLKHYGMETGAELGYDKEKI